MYRGNTNRETFKNDLTFKIKFLSFQVEASQQRSKEIFLTLNAAPN